LNWYHTCAPSSAKVAISSRRGGYALNGKLLENTHEEWRASPYARDGVQCQGCHMPDPRHLWQGIHDRRMVKQALTIDLRHERNGSALLAVLEATNSGVGHYFPTYVTPKVFLWLDLVDASGRQVDGSLREQVIGREVPLNLSREIYDTRLAPKASLFMRASWQVSRSDVRLRARIVVEPDHFYVRFFKAIIDNARQGRPQLELALRQASDSPYTLFREEREI